ncbi:MAG TPA: ABC transporter transmembrane domain-containing protein [Puia sp.]|nr:ABC transporter transmembrane domain-containing protein [Puia sp.]
MKVFMRLLGFSKPYHHYIPEYAVFILLYIIFSLLNFSLLIPLLDTLFGKDNTHAVTALPAFHFSADYFKNLFYYWVTYYIGRYGRLGVLVYVCVIILLSVLLKNIFGYLSQKVLTRMRVNLVRKIREQLFEQFSTQSLSFYHKQKKGNLLAVLSSDVVEIESTVVTSIQVIFKEPLIILATFAMLFYYSAQLTLFTIIFFPISGFLISSISRRLKRKGSLIQESIGRLLSFAEEAMSGIRIIKIFNAERFVRDRFSQENSALSKTLKSTLNQRELSSPLSEFLGVFVILVIVVYGGSLILSGHSALTASAFITYIAFYFQIIEPAKNTASAISYMQRGLAAGERVLAILDSRQPIMEKADAVAKAEFTSSIEFRDVGFRYDQSDVLENIDLVIPKGRMVALVGQSGAGKSTMTDLIPRFYDATGGSILIDGIDVRDIRLKDLRSLMSMVSQEAILFNDTVANNIAFGMTEVSREQVILAAKIANAHEFIEGMEEGYETVIGDRGARLSGGQKQRITIARAVLKNPPILILDEATSSLDTESERIVQEAINNMMQNRTSIVIAHRLSTVRHADEIIVLQNGRIIERGCHDSLISQNGFYRRLVEMQEVK